MRFQHAPLKRHREESGIYTNGDYWCSVKRCIRARAIMLWRLNTRKGGGRGVHAVVRSAAASYMYYSYSTHIH